MESTARDRMRVACLWYWVQVWPLRIYTVSNAMFIVKRRTPLFTLFCVVTGRFLKTLSRTVHLGDFLKKLMVTSQISTPCGSFRSCLIIYHDGFNELIKTASSKPVPAHHFSAMSAPHCRKCFVKPSRQPRNNM